MKGKMKLATLPSVSFSVEDNDCSICLEDYSEADPPSVTGCGHEYHLHCILCWCQRSAHCPICWEPISMKNATGQKLLDSIQMEKSAEQCQNQSTTVFRHPLSENYDPYDDFPFDEDEVENAINLHASSMRCYGNLCRHLDIRKIFQSLANVFFPKLNLEKESPPLHITTTEATHNPNFSNSSNQSTTVDNVIEGPSNFHSTSMSLKLRFLASSNRYKESVIKRTKQWKERLFSYNQSARMEANPE